MKNYAKINLENTVVDILVFEETPALSLPEGWKLIEYVNDGSIRSNPAVINGKYDSVRDIFINIQDYPSWTLNENTGRWEPPTPYPNDGNFYQWNEETQSWDAPQ
jgi:hypothetical protein